MKLLRWISLSLLSLVVMPVQSFADGLATDWQFGFQEAATPVMEEFIKFHNVLLWVIFATAIFVTLLLLIVVIKFNRKSNPVPSRTTHNTFLEIVWTLIPVLILVLIAVPSLRTLYYAGEVKDADMTIKAVGYKWYWVYEYPDHDAISFESRILSDDELKEGDVRLLSVDNPLVVPVNTAVRLQTTASDVIHAWAMPAFGVKVDAVPGRLNESWFKATKEGTYYGQCSELCGSGHGFMPIEIHVVSDKEFKQWLSKAKEDFAG